MKFKKTIGAVLACSLAFGAAATPAFAYPKKAPIVHGGSSSGFPFIVACVWGSALGAIITAYYIGRKYNRELTNAEARAILFSCGLGTVLVAGQQNGN